MVVLQLQWAKSLQLAGRPPRESYEVKKKKKTDTPVVLVFLLFLVPLPLSIEIDAFLVQSKFIQLL